LLPVEAPVLQPPTMQMSETRARPISAAEQRRSELSVPGTPVEKVKHSRKFAEDGSVAQDKLTTRLKGNRHTVPREGSTEPSLGTPAPGHVVSPDVVLKGEYLTEPGRRQTIETTSAPMSGGERALLGSSAPMTRRTKHSEVSKHDGDVHEESTTSQLEKMSKQQREVLGMEDSIGWPQPAAPSAARLLVKGEHKATTTGDSEREQDIQTSIVGLSDAARLSVGIEHGRPLTERSKHVVKTEDGEVVEDKTTRNLRQMPAKLGERLGVPSGGRALDRDAHDFVPGDLTIKDEHKTSTSDGTEKEQWIDTKVKGMSDDDRLGMGMTHRAPLTERTKHVVTDDGDGTTQDKHTTSLSGMSKKVKGQLGVPARPSSLGGGGDVEDVSGELVIKSERMTQTNEGRQKDQTITSTLKQPPAEFGASGAVPWVERTKHVVKQEGGEETSNRQSVTWRPMTSDELEEYGYDLRGARYKDVRAQERSAKKAHEKRESGRA
jgi:hypothetical protein